MKKHLKLLLPILFISVFILTSCRSFWGKVGEPLENYTLEWYVSNSSDHEIRIVFQDDYRPRFFDIKPDESIQILLQGRHLGTHDTSFYVIEEVSEYSIAELYLKNSATLIKRWVPGDKNNPGKQFYNDKFWTYDDSHGRSAWTFEITSADLE